MCFDKLASLLRLLQSQEGRFPFGYEQSFCNLGRFFLFLVLYTESRNRKTSEYGVRERAGGYLYPQALEAINNFRGEAPPLHTRNIRTSPCSSTPPRPSPSINLFHPLPPERRKKEKAFKPSKKLSLLPPSPPTSTLRRNSISHLLSFLSLDSPIFEVPSPQQKEDGGRDRGGLSYPTGDDK